MAARASILVWLAVLSQLGLQPCLATRMGGGLAGASLRTKTKVSGQEADALSDLDADIADVSNRHLGIASSRSNSSTGKLKGKSNGTQAWWGRRRVSPTPAPSPEDTSTTTIESTSTSTTLPDTLPEEEDTTTTTTETTTSSTTLPDTLPEEEDTTTTTTETTTSSTTLPDTLPEEEGEAPGIDSKTEDTSSGGDSGSTTKTEGSGEDSSSGEDSGSTTKTEGSGEDSSSGGDSGSTTKTEGSGEDSSSGGDSGSTTKTEGSGEDSSSGGASGSTTKTEGSGEDSSSGGASGSSTKPEGSGEDSSSGGASGSTTKTEGSGEDSSSDTSSTTTSSTVTSKPTSRTPAPTPAPEGDEEIDGTITCTNRLYGGAVGAVLGGGVGYSLGSLGGVTAGVAAAVGIFPGALFTSMFSTFVVPEYRTVKCDDGYEPVEARIACYGSDKPRCRKKAEDSKNGGASASTSTPAPAAGGASGSTTKSKTEDSSSGGASGSTTKSESSGEDSSSGSAATDEDEMDMGAGEDVAMEEAAKHMPKMNEYTSDSIEDELDLRPENEVTRPEALPSRMENASTQQEGATRNANSVIEGLRDLGEEGIGNSSTEDNIEDDESTKAAEETGELDEEGEDAIEEIMNFRGNIDEYEEKDESTQASAATPPAAPPARPALLDTGVRRISPQTGQKAKKSKGKGRSGQNEDDNDDNMNSSAKESDEDDDEKDVHPEDLFVPNKLSILLLSTAQAWMPKNLRAQATRMMTMTKWMFTPRISLKTVICRSQSGEMKALFKNLSRRIQTTAMSSRVGMKTIWIYMQKIAWSEKITMTALPNKLNTMLNFAKDSLRRNPSEEARVMSSRVGMKTIWIYTQKIAWSEKMNMIALPNNLNTLLNFASVSLRKNPAQKARAMSSRVGMKTIWIYTQKIAWSEKMNMIALPNNLNTLLNFASVSLRKNPAQKARAMSSRVGMKTIWIYTQKMASSEKMSMIALPNKLSILTTAMSSRVGMKTIWIYTQKMASSEKMSMIALPNKLSILLLSTAQAWMPKNLRAQATRMMTMTKWMFTPRISLKTVICRSHC
eukprot:TRINITY_DN483_c0_g1_i6.p1 TRINITY_DN483_c0_g1~~TRINITY_DN483_c0_g1_i6.p1  ORF type:complete len:1063 (-),score=181.67 TRINITY_DN483_c0_g1_i6:119-3307(-)